MNALIFWFIYACQCTIMNFYRKYFGEDPSEIDITTAPLNLIVPFWDRTFPTNCWSGEDHLTLRGIGHFLKNILLDTCTQTHSSAFSELKNNVQKKKTCNLNPRYKEKFFVLLERARWEKNACTKSPSRNSNGLPCIRAWQNKWWIKKRSLCSVHFFWSMNFVRPGQL